MKTLKEKIKAEAKDANKLIKNVLKKAFPGVKFTVTGCVGMQANNLRVKWPHGAVDPKKVNLVIMALNKKDELEIWRK